MPSERPKNEFCEGEAMFQGVEMQCEFIFCILEIDKSYFDVHLSDVLCR
jgi:hypothetical protein